MGLPTGAMMFQGAGMLVSSYGAGQQARAQNKALQFQARLAEQNREQLKAYAKDVRAAGKKQAMRQRTLTQLLVGEQRAAGAASGVRVDAGSVGELAEETARYGEEDAIELEYAANKRAAAAEARARSLGMQAAFYRMSQVDPTLAGMGPLLQGAGGLWGFYRQGNTSQRGFYRQGNISQKKKTTKK